MRGVTSANYRQQAKTVAYNYAATPAAAAAATPAVAAKPAEGALRTAGPGKYYEPGQRLGLVAGLPVESCLPD